MVPFAELRSISLMSKSDDGSLRVKVKMMPISVVVDPLLTTAPGEPNVPLVAVMTTVGPTPSVPVVSSLKPISLLLLSMIVPAASL